MKSDFPANKQVPLNRACRQIYVQDNWAVCQSPMNGISHFVADRLNTRANIIIDIDHFIQGDMGLEVAAYDIFEQEMRNLCNACYDIDI